MAAHATNESHRLVFRNGTCAVLLPRDCKFADADGRRCKDASLAIVPRKKENSRRGGTPAVQGQNRRGETGSRGFGALAGEV